MFFHNVAQVLAIEQDERNDTTTDGSIRKVEYRAEEDEMLPSYKWHPFGPVGLDEREVEHVHHLAIEPV
jgi:hypothetical protein